MNFIVKKLFFTTFCWGDKPHHWGSPIDFTELGTVHAYDLGMNRLQQPGAHITMQELALNPKEIRRNLGMNQHEFWTRIGVTQSGGSRYESGRTMPRPVRELLRLVHVERLDLSKVKREDFDVLDHMKSNHPDLYQDLRRALRKQGHKSEDTTH